MSLVTPRMDRLFAIAQRILRDIHQAEDALQDAVVAAWRDIRGLRDADRFDAWLRRLLVNVCIAAASRERRRASNLREMPLEGPAAPDDILPIAVQDQLERAFRRVSPEQRALLVLQHFEGYAPWEIADALGIPASTARSRLQHAHQAMRAALEADARTISAGGVPR